MDSEDDLGESSEQEREEAQKRAPEREQEPERAPEREQEPVQERVRSLHRKNQYRSCAPLRRPVVVLD